MVAGLGLALVERLLGGRSPGALRLARGLHPFGAALAAGSLLVDEGTTAGVLAGAWLVVSLCATTGGVMIARRTWRRAPERRTLGDLTIAAGLCYLSVGASWLVISRLGLHPFDLSTDIVRMTAIHFHYAGFALPVLAAAGLAGVDWFASRVSLVAGCLAAVAGPPIVAVGFVFDSAVGQIGGALVMTVATWAVAFGTFLLATSTTALALAPAPTWIDPSDAADPSGPPPGWGFGAVAANGGGRALLVVSAVSPVVPMVLAVQWAVAQHVAMPALSIDAMASTHGVLNGVGFVMVGLVGWLLVVPRPVVGLVGADGADGVAA